MKQFKIYIGQNNETKQQIDVQKLKDLIKRKYKEFNGYTIYNANGIFNGKNEVYDEPSTILEIVTDNLYYSYIEELCYTLKEVFKQECIFYTEFTVKGRMI